MKHPWLHAPWLRTLTGPVLLLAMLSAPTKMVIGQEAEETVQTEFVVLSNGDRLHGEIKSLERGLLKFKTDGDAGTVSIEWDKVRTLSSGGRQLEIELTQGERFLGTILTAPREDSVRVAFAADTIAVERMEIVQMTPIKRSFWARLGGGIEFGFAFTKANKAVNYNLVTRLDYRASAFIFSLNWTSFLQTQTGAETTKRNDLNLSVTNLLSQRWFLTGLGSLEQNQELQLDLRGTLAVGGGRDMIQSNRVTWNALLGLGTSREDYTGLAAATTVQLIFNTSFNWFTFGDNDSDLSSNLSVLPILNESKRWRINFDMTYRQDVLGDFYLAFNFWDSFDSRPPVGGTNNDFGTSITVGWSP